MAIIKLKHFQIIAVEKYFDEIIKYAASTGRLLMLEHTSSDIPVELENCFKQLSLRDKIDRISLMKKKLENLAEILDMQLDKNFSGSQIKVDYNTICEYEDSILNIESQILKIHEKINLFKAEIKKVEDLKHKLEFLISINLQFNISIFNDFYFIEMIYGRMSIFNSKRFKEIFANDANSLYYELKTENETSYFLLIYLKSQKININKVLNSLYFEPLDIPSNILDKPKHIIPKLDDDIELLNCELEKCRLEKKYKLLLFGSIIKKMYNDLAANVIIKEIEERSGRLSGAYLITGWIPENFDEEFKYKIDNISKQTSVYFSQTAESYHKRKNGKIKVPSLIENSIFFKPFEFILKMYGTPSYFEYDPTKIVAVSFLIMFGLMFGDAGQGFIIFLLGWLLQKKIDSKLAAFIIMKYMGISSVVFGVLYGEYFGFEFTRPLWILPSESTDYFLIFTVCIGIFMITAGIIMNIVNSHRNKDYESLYFGKNGVAGLIFYWGTLITGLLIIFKIINFGLNFPTFIIVLMFWIFPLGIMILKEPLAHYIAHNKFVIEGDKANYFVLAFVELLDTVLSFLSNSVSFVRIAAFALNHVGLFAVVKIIADIINVGRYDRDVDILIFILGNILIICIESVIVTIQILRLEYYEFFSKFYSGDGVIYNPDRLEIENKFAAQ